MKKTRIFDALLVFIIVTALALFVSPELCANMGITGIAVAQVLMAMTAIAAVMIRKENVHERLSLSLPPIKSFFGAVVLLMGANAWQNSAASFLTGITGQSSSGNDTAVFESFYQNASPFVVLITLALAPAVCEELVFRGYLLTGFKTKKSSVPAIIITAVLFAGIHLDIYKFFPLLIMGAAYAYIAAATSSVIIPVIFHFINNSLSVISFYTMKNAPETMEAVPSFVEESFLGFGITSLGIGMILIYLGSRIISGKPRKKRTTLITLITSGAVALIGAGIMVYSLVYTPYDGHYTDRIREDTVYTEYFTVKEEAYAMIEVSVMTGRDVDCNITINDSEGEVVYEYGSLIDQIITLEPGEYSVNYRFDVKENDSIAHDVAASVKVNCLSLTSSVSSEKGADDTTDSPASKTDESVTEESEADTEEISEPKNTTETETTEADSADTVTLI